MIRSSKSRAFSTLFLDLDDTLYPHGSGVWQAVGSRIDQFLIEEIGFESDQAIELRSEYLRTYGTTLAGLMRENAIDPFAYLDYVHDIPVESLIEPDPALREMLRAIKLKKVIFTNATETHAIRVIEALEISEEIDLIVDIIKLEYANKPLREAYQKALAMAGEEHAASCLMVDDRWDNIHSAREIGMVGIWLQRDGEPCPEAPCISDILNLNREIQHFSWRDSN